MSSGGQSVCPECGSLRTRQISGNPLQRVLAALRRQDVIVCGRCGWRGRQFRLSAKGSMRQGREAADSRRADTLDYQALDRAMTQGSDAPLRPGHRS